MKVLGLVVEYNPFHTGHLHHIEEAKRLVQPDYTIAIMSGSFVQRGEVAIIDKFTRSELAVKYGVDLVVELPFVYVMQSADYFCHGAMSLLNALGVSDVVFGSESGDLKQFKDIAYAIKKHPEHYHRLVKDAMNQGLRYPDACNQALSKLLNHSITTPNDLLGLGYVKDVVENDYSIEMHCIKRNNSYHATKLQKVSSASALRVALKKQQDVEDYLFDMSCYQRLFFQEQFFPYLKYKILMESTDQLRQYHLVSEGIENLLKKNILLYHDYDRFVESLTSKRYTKTRIQRMLIHILMNNTSSSIQESMPVDYVRVLKMNEAGQRYLNSIKKTCPIQIITTLSKHHHPALDLDIKATKLLSLLDEHAIDKDFQNIPIFK